MTRRGVLAVGGAAVAAGALGAGGRRAVAATAEPISIVINQSPWFDSFRQTVALYEKETGNKVDLDVNPFAGSLEKQRNSVRAAQGQYDLLVMNSGWFAEMYFGGFLEAISDIDPSFKLDPDVYTLNDTIYFDPVKKVMAPGGKLMSIPISPLIPLLYYRGDLYKQAGLTTADTFAELEANARKLNNPPRIYGIVQRGARGTASVSYDFDQADVIQNMVTGKAAHIMTVIAAWSQMDDPNKSAVVDKVEFAPPPHAPGLPTAPGLGHWLGGISNNVPDGRKRAAVEFLRWFQGKDAQLANVKAGGIPINAAVYRDPIAQERRYRWMKPMAEALPHAVNIYQFPQGSEVTAILDLGLNRAVAGEITSVEALNTMAEQIYGVMAKYGYNTGKLPPLH